MPNSNGKSKDRFAPMITSASVPVFSRRRFVALFGAAASLVLMGCQRPVMGHNRLGHERGKAPSGTVYFQDGFDQDADTFRSWDQVYINNNSATTDAAVVRVGTHSLKLSVEDIDTNTFGWSGIRSQIVKRDLFFEGGERYIGWSTYVPANHPTPTSWHNLAQFGYTGETPPPTLFGMFASHHFKLIDDSASQGILKWRSPTVLKGAWHDFVVRILFHRNPNIGFVELWVDGVKQTMTNGQQRIYYSTLNPLESADALSHLHICNYRRRNQMQWSTIYHDAVKVGDSYAAVDPAG